MSSGGLANPVHIIIGAVRGSTTITLRVVTSIVRGVTNMVTLIITTIFGSIGKVMEKVGMILQGKKGTERKNNESDKEMGLATMLREFQAYYQKQARPAGDEEAGIPEKQTVERFIQEMLDEKPARFSSPLLQIFTSNYSTKLGEGGYGAVYKGHFPNGQQLAVKVLNSHSVDERIEEQFIAEVNTIGRTYHRNIVRLFGFCFEANIKALVYEYMENGSLDKLLFGNEQEIEWDKLHEIAIGAARGLEYLHHFSPRRIVHYDIKPANVLLDSNFHAKIADFGLAKLFNRDTTNVTLSRVGGTPGYAAPEIYMPFPISYKCDVYSFGVMLFEIIGRKRNFDSSNLGDQSQVWFPRQVWEKFDKGELEEILADCDIEEKDMEKAKTMVKVALWCVQYLPEARPSMRDVVKILEGGAEAAIPPNPFQHLMSSGNLPSCIVSSYTESEYDDHDDTSDTTNREERRY